MGNSRQRARGMAAGAVGRTGLLLALLVLAGGTAQASCLAAADPGLRALQDLANADARQAVQQAQQRIAALQGSAADPTRLATLYDIEALGYSALELDRDARAAAALGLAQRLAPQDPIRLELLMVDAENVYDQAGIQAALQAIEAAGAAQPPRSLAATCLQITAGLLQYREDRSDLAIVSLTQAYDQTRLLADPEPRMHAANNLSAVMRSLGDETQALALNQEVIDWARAHDALLALSVAHYTRGTIFLDSNDDAQAQGEYTEARRLSVMLGDRQGIAFADLRLCETQVDLGHLAAASTACGRALPVFLSADSIDMVKETRALQARIDLQSGRAAAALATLNGVLDHGGRDLSARRVGSLYELRAQANAALHRYDAAYADLARYLQRLQTERDADRQRQEAALRARFETDRQIERNVRLERELALTRERSEQQRVQLRWEALGVVAAALVIVLLTYILLANLRHRRELVRLAAQDALTGLPNRRRTVELASAALALAQAQRRVLTLALLDMDHFKLVNDRCGHGTGDRVLQEFARGSRETLRAGDILGRWGGEEFLLVLPDTPLEAAIHSLERLRSVVLAIHLPASGGDLRVTLSAGLAIASPELRSLDELVARADAALYEAKNQGRDLVRVATNEGSLLPTGVRRALRQA